MDFMPHPAMVTREVGAEVQSPLFLWKIGMCLWKNIFQALFNAAYFSFRNIWIICLFMVHKAIQEPLFVLFTKHKITPPTVCAVYV